MTVTDIVMVVLGLAACFAGYSMFRSMMPVWGFMLGGWIAYTLLPVYLPAQAGEVLYQIGSFVLGGILGAAIALPLYFVLIFLSGGALGMLMGILVGAVIDVGGISSIRQLDQLSSLTFPPSPNTATQFLMMVIFGLVLGGTAIMFQKFMVCASSAFIGAGALITGLGGTVINAASTDTNKSIIMLLAWLILGLVGTAVQYRMLDET